MKKVKENLTRVKDNGTKQQLLEDIRTLQLSNTEDEFNSASSLFWKKWSTTEVAKDFVS